MQGPKALLRGAGRYHTGTMPIIDGRTWMEHLSEATCWELLARTAVGRIAVLVDGAPEIYPVNFVVDDRSIAFRTGPGSKLRGLGRFPTTCFEADSVEADLHAGWSVMVKGRAVEVSRPEESARLATIPLTLWTAGVKDRWVRIRAVEVTGRRIHTTAVSESTETARETRS